MAGHGCRVRPGRNLSALYAEFVTGDKRTALYEEHLAAGAKMVPFAGYLMPIEYPTGIVAEHRAVRAGMGMFDLSHMGELVVAGPGSLEAVDRLVTNQVSNLEMWQARYTPLCRDDGGIIDDVLVYRFPDHIMLVVNASNIEKDEALLRDRLGQGPVLRNVSDDVSLIAVQGPRASEFVQRLSPADISSIAYYHFIDGEVAGVPCVISRTGYTGEDGLELYMERPERARELWRSLADAGRDEGLIPVGLGARDTLRLEAGLALYGNDISDQTTPLEASLGWTVKLQNREFTGSDVLARQRDQGVGRKLMAFSMIDRSIPRPHYRVYLDGKEIGEVTSGSFSPTFNKGIGLAYIEAEQAKVGKAVDIEIRGHRHPAEIVKKPIYSRPG